jgi:D-tyrosyl-tRNA(Tyr) deacylase
VSAFAGRLRERGATVAEGRFGAMMRVELINDGPVTVIVEL